MYAMMVPRDLQSVCVPEQPAQFSVRFNQGFPGFSVEIILRRQSRLTHTVAFYVVLKHVFQSETSQSVYIRSMIEVFSLVSSLLATGVASCDVLIIRCRTCSQ